MKQLHQEVSTATTRAAMKAAAAFLFFVFFVGSPLLVQGKKWHVKTTTAYSSNGDLVIESPSTNPNHMLFLFLSRTDSYLPLKLKGWERPDPATIGAECFKSYNEQPQCFHEKDCITRGSKYCWEFVGGRSGRDLATVVFYRRASDKLSEFQIKMKGSRHASWAIVTAMRGANHTHPIHGGAATAASCDHSKQSQFVIPANSINRDVLLLSQAYDDRVDREVFGPPPTTKLLGYTRGDDETGFLYGKRISNDSDNGNNITALTTTGDGSYHCKDALIAISIRSACRSLNKYCGRSSQCCRGLTCRSQIVAVGSGSGGSTNTSNKGNNKKACQPTAVVGTTGGGT